VAGFFAGFSLVDGAVVSRATKTYAASTNVLLTAPNPNFYQVEVPAVTQAVPLDAKGNPVTQQLITTQQAATISLSNSAIILAYVASSDAITATVANDIGGFRDGESITAVRRTTQPNGDERFAGRLELPIIQIAGIAASPERAKLIAVSATAAFSALVAERQREGGIAEDIRLNLDELNAPVAHETGGSNAAIPSVVVGFGVFLLFIALALIVGIIRERLSSRRVSEPSGDVSEPSEDDEQEDSDGAPLAAGVPVPDRAGRSVAEGEASDDVDESTVSHA
jgi:hypothetical protein